MAVSIRVSVKDFNADKLQEELLHGLGLFVQANVCIRPSLKIAV
jgi:hypothetical protein